MEGHDIDRINVHRVLRIHNKFLRNRFDEKVESYLDMTNPSYRKNFEYLFIGVDPERPEDFNYFMEKGFRSPNEGDSLGLGSFPVLFNTINGAEGPRINSLRGKSGKEGDSMEEEGRKEQRIPTASILVCKVVMIKPNQDTENPTFSIGSEMKKIYSSIESAKKAALKTPESNSTFREAVPKKGKLDHRVYFVHDYTLIIPEYLIYLDYESDKMDMQTTYLGDSLVKLPNKDASFFRLNDDKNPESNLDFLFRSKLEKVKAKYTDPKFKNSEFQGIQFLNFEEFYKSGIDYLKVVILNYFTFLENLTLDIQAFKAKIPLIEQYKKSHISKDKITQSDLEDAESFSLNCLGLESIPLSSSVQNLKTIDLSCNHLKSFDFVQYMPNLERLVLISNRIELVSTRTAGLKRIEYIDLSFNGIRDANQFKSMNQLHSLKHLLLRGNPLIFRTPNYFDQIIPHLPSLKYLDEKPVDEQRKKLSSSPFRTLDAELVAKEQSKTSEGGPCTIKLNHMKLIGISINTNFADLQNLDISNNNLTKLDGLQFFPRLTHLKAENNLLTDITDVGHLLHLRILELGSNCISNPGHSLTGLKELTLLSMDRNKIRSLASFTELSVLLELYLGENLIEDLKEVRNLGSLKKLVVLDLLGNPMCRDAEYRLFCVFNIKEIKVLDGNNVVQKEFEDSKQAFMGKLSDELLAERLRGRNMQTLVSMDLSHCNLRDFDNIFTSQKFPKIVEMDLTGNHFTNLRCFGYLPTLKELSLAENKLTSLETGTDPKVKIGLYGLPVSFGYTES